MTAAPRTARSPPKSAGTCQYLPQHLHWLWMLLDHEGVEPTINAERTRTPSGRHLAQTQLRHSDREGPSLRRDAADRHRNLPPRIPQRLSVRDRHHQTPRCPTASTTTPSRGVNGYISLRLIFSGVRPKYLANACTASRYAFCP